MRYCRTFLFTSIQFIGFRNPRNCNSQKFIRALQACCKDFCLGIKSVFSKKSFQKNQMKWLGDILRVRILGTSDFLVLFSSLVGHIFNFKLKLIGETMHYCLIWKDWNTCSYWYRTKMLERTRIKLLSNSDDILFHRPK